MKDHLKIDIFDTMTNKLFEIQTDMVVLVPALVPRLGADALARVLTINQSADGFFLEAHPKLRPVDTNTAGVFLAGACHSPKDIPESVAQAGAAASKALGLVCHTRLSREPTIGVVDESSCNGCFECEGVCAYGAIGPRELKDKKDNLSLSVLLAELPLSSSSCSYTGQGEKRRRQR